MSFEKGTKDQVGRKQRDKGNHKTGKQVSQTVETDLYANHKS